MENYPFLQHSNKIHGAIVLGNEVGSRLLELQPHHCGQHVALSGIHAGVDRWGVAADIRKIMAEARIRKVPACCSGLHVNTSLIILPLFSQRFAQSSFRKLKLEQSSFASICNPFISILSSLDHSLVLNNMADALVSVVLEQLSSIIAQKVQKEVGLVAGVKDEVPKLESNFQAIQDVLADAEQRQLKEGSIKRWMDQLKHVSYDMDDVLDEWSTAIAKSQMKVNDEHPRKTIKKVCSFRIFSCFCFREVGLRFHVARKIQTLNDRIDGIVSDKNTFNFTLSEGGPNLPERKITASVIDAAEIKGRETDKGTMVKMLLGESSDQEPAPRTISLVGMGGIGKTTLAQLVYNDHEVETYFGKRIWVCVSDPFDETRIAKAILEALVGSAQDVIELQALLERIQESVSGKRLLLVLDDVWNEDSTKWEQLKNSLKRGCLPGSRILVTTRKREVASIMGSSSTDILELGLLSPDECWSLFNSQQLKRILTEF
ncbi:hypothetical protein DKX38_027689 [Salix brachista]|uniref:NB-ARC domain-containing protein n=1 Tax=Salix brachista TaxID=2182728 RepID=A0A5N5J8Y9_9ROSI|nr:hypothetical protein DKX38_027689 [Salix brachista]